MLPETDALNDRFADIEPVAVDENEFIEFDALNDTRDERVADRLSSPVEDSEDTLLTLGSAVANALKDSKGALVTLGCNVTVFTVDPVDVDDTD